MVMKQLLEKCSELPGIQTVDHGEYAELKYRNGHDNGCMAFVPIFPGITLAFIKIQSGSWPAPDLFGMLSSDRGPFIINYCISGRCELQLNNDSYVYVTENQFSLSESYARNNYIYPERNYNGIEIFVDMEAVKQSTFLSEHFEINMEELSDKYCKGLKTYIAPAAAELAGEFTALWRSYETKGICVDARMKVHVLTIFSILSEQTADETKQTCTFYTKSQVAIAKAVREILTSDLAVHHSAKELAGRYSISESSLKNYFRGVYGRNISDYMNRLRMERAAELLEDTGMSVLEVAEKVGYQNQSKFAAAFKREYALSPRQYRLEKSTM